MKRIVLIDDSRMVLRTFGRKLEEAGYEVHVLDDPGKYSPDLDAPPDVILLDVNMPQFYGDDMVPFFREEWPIKAPIYLFSAIKEEELRNRAQQCGADGYISKAWGFARVVQVVHDILA